jgi:coenzyme F420-reducing hydrogenase beta subunit
MKENVSIIKTDECFSCRSCEQSCPTKSITLEENQEGFFYPKIDENCIHCGICLTKCPAHKLREKNEEKPIENQKCHALVNKDKTILKNSSSGGLFYNLAKEVLNNDGVVFGAAYNPFPNVRQTEVTSINNLHILQGSKYVYCDTEDSYSKVKIALTGGKKVLYSGSPCQVAGLYSFLSSTAYENLITIDIICHGTPSRKLFIKYLESLSQKTKSKVVSYSFRDKAAHPLGAIKYVTEDGSVYINKVNVFDSYGAAFARHENYKMSCYTCPFARPQRISDITIGDFWGIEKFAPNFPRENGVSVCICNTEKGEDLFNKIANGFESIEFDYLYAIQGNRCLRSPESLPDKRNSFYEDIDSLTSMEFMKRIKTESKIHFYFVSIKNKIYKYCTPNFIKQIINRVKHV